MKKIILFLVAVMLVFFEYYFDILAYADYVNFHTAKIFHTVITMIYTAVHPVPIMKLL